MASEIFRFNKLEKYIERTAAEIKALRFSGQHLQTVEGEQFAESGRTLESNANVLYNSLYDLCKEFDIDIKNYFPEG